MPEVRAQAEIVRRETFAPLLYVLTYRTASRRPSPCTTTCRRGSRPLIFTTDQREAEQFLAADGVRLRDRQRQHRHSGAEIGGAFGGEKETGGGRESGSDAWRGYMRRATNTVNYSGELPLAQGVTFT